MNLGISKFTQSTTFFFVACTITWVIPNYFSYFTETLAQVSSSRQIMYTLWYGISFLIFGEMVGISENSSPRFSVRHLLGFLLASFLASLSLLLIVWFLEFEFIGRLAILKITGSTGLFCFFIQAFFYWLAGKNKPKCVLLISSDSKREIKKELHDRSLELYQWVDFSEKKEANLVSFCIENEISLLVVEKDGESNEIDVIGLLQGGTRIVNLMQFWENHLERIPPHLVDRNWLARLDLRMRDPLMHRIKRFMDIVVGILGLLFFLPILISAILVIALDSGFPVFFSQKRTGFLGREYILYKLRTMKKDAEKSGAEWAKEEDFRVTKAGKFFRKWRIDEIPQFWNVICGNMSIVGPRPERPEFQSQLQKEVPHWNCRHLVKPGMTGWAQIRYRYASDLIASEQKLAYDLFYVKNTSIALDFEIILSTLRAIGKGSR